MRQGRSDGEGGIRDAAASEVCLELRVARSPQIRRDHGNPMYARLFGILWADADLASVPVAVRMSSMWFALLLPLFASQYIALAPALATGQRAAENTARTVSGPQKAALDAQHKAESDPSEENLFVYASSLMKLDYSSAEKIYRFGIGKYPDSVRLHAGLASALWAQGHHDDAAAELWRASEIAPDDPHPLEFLVETEYIPASLSQKVAERLRQLRGRYPCDGLILFDYEMVVSNRYAPNAALPDDFVPTLQEAIRLNPRIPEAYFQLGLAYEQQKAYAKALQAMRQAVQLAPRNQHYRYNLAMLYKKTGNKGAFQRELSAFLKLRNSLPKSNPRDGSMPAAKPER
jgi:tetratricopeptide (TPR) repeat protein